jgi:site-specific DNA recombinase
MTSAILYAAKSTQDKHGSIGAQLEDCSKMAEREGWRIASTYQDEAISGWTEDRGPGLAEALEHAERVGAVLMVQHSDRLARGDGKQARHLVEIALWAMKAGVTIRSVQDPSTFENLILAAVMGERNTEDSRRKSEAVKAGLRRAFERGNFPSGPIPDGFEVVSKEPKKIRLDPDRIKVLRLIGDLADEGWGDPSIARELNRRGHRTKGGGAWTRRRIQDLLTNSIYYGGVPWRRTTEDEEINWETSFPAPWSRDDFERRLKARAGRDKAKGSDRRGAPHRNHVLAGLAVCAQCGGVMRPKTSTYRRKDGTRARKYICRHVVDGTGLCNAPPIDAELVDEHVVDELQEYLGDFEAWQEQILSGYQNERDRMQHELEKAHADVAEQEKIVTKRSRLPDVAEDDGQMREALRLVREAGEELERRQDRLRAAQSALEAVPTEAPTDAMLDFYNELSQAVRGRLAGADTVARVNEALRDLFDEFRIYPPSTNLFPGGGITIQPILREREPGPTDLVQVTEERTTWWRPTKPAEPPLRKLHAPSAEMADSQEYRPISTGLRLPPFSVAAAVDLCQPSGLTRPRRYRRFGSGAGVQSALGFHARWLRRPAGRPATGSAAPGRPTSSRSKPAIQLSPWAAAPAIRRWASRHSPGASSRHTRSTRAEEFARHAVQRERG